MKSRLLTVKDIVNFAAEKYGEKDFCKFFRDSQIEIKNLYNDYITFFAESQ